MRGAAESVVRRLQRAGHVALFAGGCVRDMLMRRRPHDYDIATSATPKEVVTLFRRTQEVGAKFGVVLVRTGRFAIEVATFRADADYEDGRHPTRVRFTDAREDALRRDFTINGMFYDPIKRKTVDYVGGQEDLNARVIRAIDDPHRRFAEDHLRILRAIRFASRLDFTIDPVTRSAMSDEAPSIRRISPERIREELDAMLSQPSRGRAFGELCVTGVLAHLWPGAEEILPNSKQIEACLETLPAQARFEAALAVVLHVLPVRTVEAACDALRSSTQTRRITSWLVANQDVLMRPAALTLADLKLLMAHPAFADLLMLFAAKLRASGQPTTPHRQILARVRAIPPDEVAPPPLFDGRHLGELGLPPGPLYKKILDRVYYAQLNGDVTDHTAAVAYAKRLVTEAKG